MYVYLYINQSYQKRWTPEWQSICTHKLQSSIIIQCTSTSLSSGSYNSIWLQIATIPASTLKISTWWGLFMVTPRIGDANFLLLLTLHPNSSLICKCIYWVLFYLYQILNSDSFQSGFTLLKYFKLLAEAKFRHWKFWDSQTPHIWFHIVNLASNIELYKIHTHTHLRTLSDFAFLIKNKKVNIHN